MFIHLGKCIYTSVHGMYMVCTSSGINVYVHRSDMYVHVYTNIYTCFESNKHVHTMYKPVYQGFVC